MPYTYTKLTDEQRAQAADAQIANFESELWGHELNLARLSAQPEDDGTKQGIRETSKAIETIERAIATTQSIRDSLEPPAGISASGE